MTSSTVEKNLTEVENALTLHPAVAESAVVASPDGTRGEVVKAVVEAVVEYAAAVGDGPGVDVLLVCWEAADYSAVQAHRRTRPDAAELPDWLAEASRACAAGQLGVLFGAGASAAIDQLYAHLEGVA